MAIYVVRYYCNKCDNYFEDGVYGHNRLNPICPNCSTLLQVKCVDKNTVINKTYKTNICYAENERLSWALGCNENQLADKMKKHPGAEFRKAKGGGYQMVVHNRPEKLQRMREAGYEEYG